MGNWYDAHGPSEWFRRSFSFLHLGLLILTLALVVAEFRFDWCETLAGRFLLSTNQNRPETGSIWESGRHTVSARQSIEGIILEKKNVEQHLRTARSFAELGEGLGGEKWINLDKARFKQLYLALGASERRALIEPARLAWLLNGDRTSRIFCEGRPGGIIIYFIDSENRVIRQLNLDIKKTGGPGEIPGRLETLEDFSGTIYPADRFFEAVFRLPEEMVPDLIPEGEALLTGTGTLDRVGIWNTAEDGYIRLGFEFVRLDQRRVVVARAREWAVWQLNLILKGEDR
ncbi:MAG: hypothetical protein HUN04_21240 [Desulfobacter sp.]|nr:MAG: hypothetical protein HUN04_21240 [Desulfobacter sp.]